MTHFKTIRCLLEVSKHTALAVSPDGQAATAARRAARQSGSDCRARAVSPATDAPADPPDCAAEPVAR